MVRFISRVLFCPLLLTVGCYTGGANSELEDGGEDAAGDGDGGPGADDGDGPAPAGGFPDPGECVDTTRFFEDSVWTPVLLQDCIGCHNAQGDAKHTDLMLRMPDYAGYLEVNEQTVSNVSRLEIDGTSLLLLKPTMSVDHAGGRIFEVGSEKYEAFAEMVERFKAPTHCVDDLKIAQFFKGLVELSEGETLRKAAQILVNRAPTIEELGEVAADGEAGLDRVLDAMMEEDVFYERLMVIFNDHFLTDGYLAGDNAVDTVDEDRFPNARWYDALPEDQINGMRNATNDMIAREPLEMIKYVVQNHLPFSEVITADYVVTNPMSGRAYDIPMELYDDPNDASERKIWSFDYPQAGMLTTSVMLDRYPTTPTNRNRARSRMVYDFFLGIDVMRLASRPTDIAADTSHNPTMNNAQCSVCHANVDPLAGAFKNWDEEGRYVDTSWFDSMRAPGFGEVVVPTEDNYRALQWATEHLVEDPKFALGIVRLAYESLTGQAPLVEPSEPSDADYGARVTAFRAQDWVFKKVAAKFKASNYELRTVFKELIKGPYFRVINAEGDLEPERELELADMGTARLIPPELMHERLISTTGYAWTKNGQNVFLSGDYYRFFYGGIDSEAVTTRLTEMNGVMASIVMRMSNEVACNVTGLDFAKDQAERKLFREVELTDTPDSLGGEEAIKANLSALYGRLYGRVASDDELERSWQLLRNVYEDGQSGLAEGALDPYPVNLPGQCQATDDPISGAIPPERQVVSDENYMVRSWMAVMTYMLADYEFLFD